MFSVEKLKSLLMMTLVLPFTLLATAPPIEYNPHSKVYVKGEATYLSPNSISDGFNANVTKIHIRAYNNHIHKGTFSVSSTKAGPVDPVTGIDFEAHSTIDAVKVFEDHPEIVWCHGVSTGTITYGSSSEYGELAGQTFLLNDTNGEFIGAITPWGRTNFLTVFENENNPLPNFATATESELIELVEGFSRIMLTTGAQPGKVKIETKSKTFIIPYNPPT